LIQVPAFARTIWFLYNKKRRLIGAAVLNSITWIASDSDIQLSSTTGIRRSRQLLILAGGILAKFALLVRAIIILRGGVRLVHIGRDFNLRARTGLTFSGRRPRGVGTLIRCPIIGGSVQLIRIVLSQTGDTATLGNTPETRSCRRINLTNRCHALHSARNGFRLI
jgi:hypothetical protein